MLAAEVGTKLARPPAGRAVARKDEAEDPTRLRVPDSDLVGVERLLLVGSAVVDVAGDVGRFASDPAASWPAPACKVPEVGPAEA